MNGHPPKPRLALAIGVIGHRPNRLSEEPDVLAATRTEIARVLDTFARAVHKVREVHRESFDNILTDEAPLLSIVSALAEGADTIVANVALNRKEKDFVLDVPLPFPVAVYREDFVHKAPPGADESKKASAEADTQRALADFEALLHHEKRRSLLVLPGKRDPAPRADGRDLEAERAYEAVGLTVLSQADLILTIWNGGPSAGRGGTTDMLATAVRMDLPIIHVDATGNAETRVLWGGLVDNPVPAHAIEDLPAARCNEEAVFEVVEALVRPPEGQVERNNLSNYLGGGDPGPNWRLEYPALMALLGVRPPGRGDVFPADPEALANEYRNFAAPAAGGDVEAMAAAYGWADATGVRFAQMFRSAFVLNFAFAAFAVACAAASVIFHEAKPVLVIAELLLIAAVVWNTRRGWRQGWHRLWFEAREVAERLRVALPLWALGIRPATFFTGKEPTWTGWYARAVVRAQGMRQGCLDTEGLANARAVMAKFLQGDARKSNPGVLEHQDDYNGTTSVRMQKMEHRLERIGGLLFGATALVAGLYLLLFAVNLLVNVLLQRELLGDGLAEHIVTALTAGLPALATATYGIRVIGDFEGTALRTTRTQAALARTIAAIRQDNLELGLLRGRALLAADAMLGDVASWRLAAESRGLAIPG